MVQKETSIQNDIRVAVSRGATRLWRNNVGVAVFWRKRKKHTVKFGLCKGSSDLIGYHTMTITPDMVGKRVAVFTALEVKTPLGQPSGEQTQFIKHVLEAGGIASIVRSDKEAHAKLKAGPPSLHQ